MAKEPFVFHLFRLILTIIIVIFLGMLYWSSILIEDDILKLEKETQEISEEIKNLNETRPQTSQKPETNFVSLADANYPNLLSEDLFYLTTLPQMLGPHFQPHGVRKEATVGKPDNLHPFSNWSQVAGWHSQCTVALGTQHFGIYETFAPEMATKMELRLNANNEPEFWLHLRRDLYWAPLNPDHFNGVPLDAKFLKSYQVTAQDFKFYYDAIMNPFVEGDQAVALRDYYQDVEEVKVLNDFTLIVKWKTHEVTDLNGKPIKRMKYLAKSWTLSLRPLASFVFKYFMDGSKIVQDDVEPNTYQTNSIWAQNFNQHWAKNIIVSCGPWLFQEMTDREIRFKRNPHFFSPLAVLVDDLDISFKISDDNIWNDFKAGQLDLYNLPPNQLQEYYNFLESPLYLSQKEKGLAIKELDYVSRAYQYVGWNETRDFFKSKKVRQALTMAINRKRLIQDYLNGLGIEITGPFFVYSPSYDKSISPYPYDIHAAKRLLQEEGWFDSDGDGIIDKEINGKQTPFEFTLSYYVKNPTTQSICEYIATSLRDVGILCKTNGIDIADLSQLFDDKDFDAFFLGWVLGSPPEDPKQLWYSKGAKEKGSSNAIGFSHPQIDRIIEQLEYEYDYAKRIELYHEFDRILYDEAPYTFLYTPKQALVYRSYLQNVFIPANKQELIPGANVGEPDPSIFWINPP